VNRRTVDGRTVGGGLRMGETVDVDGLWMGELWTGGLYERGVLWAGRTIDMGERPLASTSGTFLANTSAATPAATPRLGTDVPDIFSHGSPIGEDSHPDDSVLDSDDGEDPCLDSATASASATAGAPASACGSSYVPGIKINEDTVSNMDTSINTSTNFAREQPLDAVYYQCRSARIAKTTTDLISISRDSTFVRKSLPSLLASAPSRITLELRSPFTVPAFREVQ
jgi:hypothetical protein